MSIFAGMIKLKSWVKALRLRTLPLSLSGIIIGSASALYSGYWDDCIFTFAIITTILFQITSNLANDLGDTLKGTDNENRVGPERSVQSGNISVKEMKIGIFISSILSLVVAGLLIYFASKNIDTQAMLFYGILALICVLAAITYTIGKKAYGYHGFGDLMVFIFFGLVSVLGVYSLYSNMFIQENILLAITIGLLSTAVLNLNNMRDYVNDKSNNKNTLVVKMGPNFAKIYHLFLILFALSSFAIFISKLDDIRYFYALIPGSYLIYHLRLVMQTTEPEKFDPELKKVALSTFAIALSFLLFVIAFK